ncbi:hypothetical protein [Hymenobacter sp. B81]|uniref:hypothetical protein n=1 Tax=Hymenobacter sp. B81 TaxID=3344878 RepID=UPI0037DD87C7
MVRLLRSSSFVAVLLSALLAQPVTAQITDSKHNRSQARKALRDARKYPAAEDLRRAHLAVDKQAMRPGESGQRVRNPEDERNRYRFDNTGTARVSDPSFQANRRKKKPQPTE